MLFQKYVTYLGNVIGQGEVRASMKTTEKLDKILEISKVEGTDKQWMRVFGFYQYSSRFIYQYARQRRFIVQKRKEYLELKKDKNISRQEKNARREDIQKAIDTILLAWNAQINKRICRIPKKGEDLLLFTDASGHSIAYVLMTANFEIVEMQGRFLNGAEQNWHI